VIGGKGDCVTVSYGGVAMERRNVRVRQGVCWPTHKLELDVAERLAFGGPGELDTETSIKTPAGTVFLQERQLFFLLF